MEREHLVDRTIATVRASAIAELRMMMDGHPQVSMTSQELTNMVDWVLREASDALKDALDSAYLDEQPGQNRWWDDPYQDEPVEYSHGGITKDYPLPRQKKDGSR